MKQFLVSLAAVRRGASPPKFKADTFNYAAALDLDRLPQRLGLQVRGRVVEFQTKVRKEVRAFNQVKDLVGAFSVIVKSPRTFA